MENFNKIKLVYGLGNPDDNYVFTYHNIGRDMLFCYMKEIKELKYALYSKYKNLILGIGKVFMNESGLAVKELKNRFKLKSQEILLVHDEADLEFLKIKISFDRGASMHKGVESVFKHLKTRKIYRLRIGIQDKKRKKAEDIILKKISGNNLEIFQKALNKFKIILDLLDKKPIEKIGLSKDFLIENGNYK